MKGFGSCHSYDNKNIKDKGQKSQNKIQGTENVVAKVKYLLLNISDGKVSNQACLGRKPGWNFVQPWFYPKLVKIKNVHI